jgi:hypothetical protein
MITIAKKGNKMNRSSMPIAYSNIKLSGTKKKPTKKKGK